MRWFATAERDGAAGEGAEASVRQRPSPERGVGRTSAANANRRRARAAAPPWPAGRDGVRAWRRGASLGGVFLECVEYGLGMACDFHRSP